MEKKIEKDSVKQVKVKRIQLALNQNSCFFYPSDLELALQNLLQITKLSFQSQQY